MKYDVIVIGGGAAGFFAAIHIAEYNPLCNIAILERGKEVLTKLKISGGGRCNVTHAEFDPLLLSEQYPRGKKELLGPFHKFYTADTIHFFEKRGIELKTEEDGRMFPVTDSSQTIIDCFLNECHKLKIQILRQHPVKKIAKKNDLWDVYTDQKCFKAEKILVTTGSNPKIWQLLKKLGHTLVPPVPSLFTFNIKDERISGLAGISQEVHVKISALNLDSQGQLLITHWGLSGPAILKLSAWGARLLYKTHYKFKLEINWLLHKTSTEVIAILKAYKKTHTRKSIGNSKVFSISKRLWVRLIQASGISESSNWATITNKEINTLSEQLTNTIFSVNGKSTFKEEFVTAGGIDLSELDFKTFESRKHKNLYFAGEVLNIDAVTGGFNFQNAWTGAYLAANAIIA